MDLNCFVYADDIVIFSETASGLQRDLKALSEYCTKSTYSKSRQNENNHFQ